ncbi:MAG: signal peptidase I [Pseudolabrys sp.]|nr:signal peptidase I [Pseudolabrys sp.]MBV9262375.1 signal peptidase I [Pseudolabrys sp.]
MLPHVRRWLRSAIEIAVIVLIVAVTRTALAEPFYVPSASMEPTLLIGDELLALKYPYGYSAASLPAPISIPDRGRIFAALPERGDIVVFRWPGDRSQVWVKRVIGLPGDHIELRNGQVIINSVAAKLEPDGNSAAQTERGQFPAARYVETLPNNRRHMIYKLSNHGPLDNMADTVVPPGHLFVMGDNRDDSADSRVPLRDGGVGLLPADNLVGRINGIIGSLDLGVTKEPLWKWPSGLRFARFFSAVQ